MTERGGKPAKLHRPLRLEDRRYTAAVIRPAMIAGLAELAEQRRIDVRPWFRGSGLTLAQCRDSVTRISFAEIEHILRRAVATFPSEPLGLLLGSRDPMQSFGVLGFALISSPSARHALETGVRYHQASGTATDFSLEDRGAAVALCVHERFPARSLLPLFCEEAFASCLVLARSLLRSDYTPQRLEVTYPAPAYVAVYRRLFRCDLHFGAEANRLVFDTALLDRPLSSSNPGNFDAALTLCRQEAEAALPQVDLVAAVERLLRERRGERPTLAQIAASLHLGERSLRRRLDELGQGFSAIRDGVLSRRACAMLTDERRLPIAVIAEALGYSDSREFRRAFRRWTGETPRVWRDRHGS